jgi:hypothetical protein
MATTGLPILTSPKRKRESSDAAVYNRSASPQSTASVSSFQEAKLREGENRGRNSPRAAVAGRLGELAIHGDQRLNFELQSGNQNNGQVAPSTQPKCWTGLESDASRMPETLPTIEGTPNPAEARAGATEGEQHTTPTSPAKKQKRSSASPRKNRNSLTPPKMRKQRLSPPLTSSGTEDPFTWHDDEITGHDPADPNDDGYGINGIGFKPTAAIAWARTEKRRRQVADWKNREAREAREKRREKRDGVGMDKMRTIQQGAIQKKVKFDV